MAISFPADYRPLLLPETREVAFNTILLEGRRCLEASHLRHVAAPVIVKSTGVPGEVHFRCNGIDNDLALPTDLNEWKVYKMAEYGIGAGYGLYTYTIIIDTSVSADDVNGPVSDRWSFIRSIEPEDKRSIVFAQAADRIFHIVSEIARKINQQFPHLAQEFPKEIEIYTGTEDTSHLLRKCGILAVISKDEQSGDVYLWDEAIGRKLHIASATVSDTALSGWISPSRIALKVLRLYSASEIFAIF